MTFPAEGDLLWIMLGLVGLLVAVDIVREWRRKRQDKYHMVNP